MSWAVTAIVVAAAGVGVGVYAQTSAAATAKATGKYNAKLAESQAKQTEMDAAENISRRRREAKRLLATQRSRFAKAGVVEEGTPLEVLAETAGILELETLDYDRMQRQQALALRAQGAADRALGSSQARAGYIGAGASLLSGSASVAADVSSYQQTKTTSQGTT